MTIGRFDMTTQKWTNAGDLVAGRYGHNAIYDGHFLLVVGGKSNKITEKCSVENGQVTCMSKTPQLNNYYAYPEMFSVPADYCEDN